MPHKLPTPKSGIMDIAPYVPGKSSVAEGVGRIIKLSSNENALGCSDKAKEAYIEALRTLNRYPDGQATLLKQAIGDVLGFKSEKLVVGAGSDEVIQFLVRGYSGPGDEVLQTAHGFLMYQIYAKSVGAKVVKAPEKDMRTCVDSLLAAVTGRTKLVFVANPNNPTGTFIPLSELKRLRDGLPSYVILVVDEAYVEYANVSGYESATSLVETTPNTVVLRTFSKAYGLPSLRLGFGYMPESIADALNRIRGPFNVGTPAIVAGAAAVKDQQFIADCVKDNTVQRDFLTKELTNLGYDVVPSACNFVLARCGVDGQPTAADVAKLLAGQGIIIREVMNYGLADFVRISIGTAEENKAVINALAA